MWVRDKARRIELGSCVCVCVYACDAHGLVLASRMGSGSHQDRGSHRSRWAEADEGTHICLPFFLQCGHCLSVALLDQEVVDELELPVVVHLGANQAVTPSGLEYRRKMSDSLQGPCGGALSAENPILWFFRSFRRFA